jgi:hypothetical protein
LTWWLMRGSYLYHPQVPLWMREGNVQLFFAKEQSHVTHSLRFLVASATKYRN